MGPTVGLGAGVLLGERAAAVRVFGLTRADFVTLALGEAWSAVPAFGRAGGGVVTLALGAGGIVSVSLPEVPSAALVG